MGARAVCRAARAEGGCRRALCVRAGRAHMCLWQAKNRGVGAPRRGEKKEGPKEGHASTRYFAAPWSYQRLAPRYFAVRQFPLISYLRSHPTKKHPAILFFLLHPFRSEDGCLLPFESTYFLPISHNPITRFSCYQELCLCLPYDRPPYGISPTISTWPRSGPAWELS